GAHVQGRVVVSIGVAGRYKLARLNAITKERSGGYGHLSPTRSRETEHSSGGAYEAGAIADIPLYGLRGYFTVEQCNDSGSLEVKPGEGDKKDKRDLHRPRVPWKSRRRHPSTVL